MAAPKFRTAYGPTLKVKRQFRGKTMTKTDYQTEADINNIMAKYLRTGLVDHFSLYEGQYGEFMEIDYHTAMNAVTSAQQMFDTVPSKVRGRFENDPAKFLAFVSDPSNLEEMREMGLAAPERPGPSAVSETRPEPPPAPPPSSPSGEGATPSGGTP